MFKAKVGKEVEFDKTVKPFKINYYPQGKPNVELVQDAGYGPLRRSDAKYTADPPVFWLDDSSFVFVHFNILNTEVKFIKVNIDTQNLEELAKLKIFPDTRGATFERLNNEELVLHYGYDDLVLNLKKGEARLRIESKAVYEFSYVFKAGAKGRQIKYEGTEIGEFFFSSTNFAAGEKIAGIVKELIVGEESYQQGMKVWTNLKKNWINVDCEEVLSLVGWVNY